MRFAEPTAAVTRRTISASAAGAACRKARAGSTTLASPKRTAGTVPGRAYLRPASRVRVSRQRPAARRTRASRATDRPARPRAPRRARWRSASPQARRGDAPRHQRLDQPAQSPGASPRGGSVTGRSTHQRCRRPWTCESPSRDAARPLPGRECRSEPSARARPSQRARPAPRSTRASGRRQARASRRDRRRCASAAPRRPPQSAKCRHTGAMRSGLAVSTSTSRAARRALSLHPLVRPRHTARTPDQTARPPRRPLARRGARCPSACVSPIVQCSDRGILRCRTRL